MRVAVVHECVHVVCFEQPGLGAVGPVETGWAWFAEGTAEWVALMRCRKISPRSVQTFEFLGDWCAFPEISIAHTVRENESSWYRAAVFVDYLVRRKKGDANWIGGLWRGATMQLGDDQDVWPKIQKLFTVDIFAEFSCDAYFLNDPANVFHSPDIYQRFGQRAWEHGYDGGTGGWIAGEVHDFACLYYGVRPRAGAASVNVEFQSGDDRVVAWLLGSDASHREVGTRISLAAGTTAIQLAAYPRLDHLVLVVATRPESSVSARRSYAFNIT